jgi:predicted unusual protein kinase regulating ubiquinone biosynthesis (AarF/ABC1/UbiB family)
VGDDTKKIPEGRLSRFVHLASMTARTAGDLAVGRARRALGNDSFDSERAAAMKVLETLGTLKGAAMKLGQQLAMDVDALPPEARELVSKLFSQAPSMGYDDIARVVTEELGKPPEQAFARFERTPLAAASLGQVHRAWLEDGTAVAVKVQYPGVDKALLADLDNVGTLVKTLGGAVRAVTTFDKRPYYEEIRREIGAEVDYRREAQLLRAYAEAAQGLPGLHVPKVFDSHSAGRVITLEYVEGLSLKAFAESNADAETRWKIARQLAYAVWGPFFRSEWVHGDPNPGNFLVRPDGRLTVLDFGAVKRVSKRFAEGLRTIVTAAVRHEEPDFVGVLEGAGFTFTGDKAEARRVLAELHQYVGSPVFSDEFDWGQSTLVPQVREHFLRNLRELAKIQPPPESLLFYRAVAGLASNLKLLRARGSYRTLCSELVALRPSTQAA